MSNKITDQKAEYLPPTIEEIMLVTQSIIAASGDPGDWNQGSIDDGFTDLFDFTSIL